MEEKQIKASERVEGRLGIPRTTQNIPREPHEEQRSELMKCLLKKQVKIFTDLKKAQNVELSI